MLNEEAKKQIAEAVIAIRAAEESLQLTTTVQDLVRASVCLNRAANEMLANGGIVAVTD